MFRQVSDTGIKVDLLQKYLFIPLDIFRRILRNKEFENDLEAWPAFLCEDDPGKIMKRKRSLVGDVIGIFSKELAILDKNTERFMIDQLQDEVNRQKEQLV